MKTLAEHQELLNREITSATSGITTGLSDNDVDSNIVVEKIWRNDTSKALLTATPSNRDDSHPKRRHFLPSQTSTSTPGLSISCTDRDLKLIH